MQVLAFMEGYRKGMVHGVGGIPGQAIGSHQNGSQNFSNSLGWKEKPIEQMKGYGTEENLKQTNRHAAIDFISVLLRTTLVVCV